jgi:hypothetical protein
MWYTEFVTEGVIFPIIYFFKISQGYQSFYLPTDTQESCFKIILKFTLKQLLHVSMQSP